VAGVSGKPPGAQRAIRASLAPASSYLGLAALVLGPDSGTGGSGDPPAGPLHWLDERHAVVVDDAEGRRPVIMEVIGRGTSHQGRTRREVVVDGWRLEVDTEPEARAALRERARRGGASGPGGGPIEVRAVIPGRVLAVAIAVGERVEAGQALLVIEAMKMQNEVRAIREGVVARLEAVRGATVEIGDLLVVLE
jgi:biotin carboxyl carrier protein